MRQYWERRIPSLDGKYTHWWLTGDNGDIIVTNNLIELIDKVSENYGKSLMLLVHFAHQNDEGDCVMNEKHSVVIADYVNDQISKRYKKRNKA